MSGDGAGGVMTRAERAVEAGRLRAQGLTYRAVAERMGMSLSYVGELCDDPNGVKVASRKSRYRRPCLECGTLLNGSDGHKGATRCVPCANARSAREHKVWTRDAIVGAIRSFVGEFGEPPAGADWDRWRCRHKLKDEARAARYEEREDWPSFGTVVRAFGSWNRALAAAGYTPRSNHGGDGNELRKRSVRAAA